ncbi:hypothetical protein Hanom_Chr08g00724941 [Helianthus anomalus]
MDLSWSWYGYTIKKNNICISDFLLKHVPLEVTGPVRWSSPHTLITASVFILLNSNCCIPINPSGSPFRCKSLSFKKRP